MRHQPSEIDVPEIGREVQAETSDVSLLQTINRVTRTEARKNPTLKLVEAPITYLLRKKFKCFRVFANNI